MPVRLGPSIALLILALALALAVVVPGEAAAAVAADAGEQSLAAALDALRDRGLKLVFSTALVKPEYRAGPIPDEAAPLVAQADALLAPFGLGLQRADGELWYVVQRSGDPATAGAPVAHEPGPALLEEVRVTAPRYRLVRDGYAVRNLSHEELAGIPALGRDVLRAVNQLPGQASMGVGARHHVRGGDSNEVTYLLDGVELLEPFHLADFHALFGVVDPAAVDTVDVYQGGFPAVFGSRMSAVVDMQLADATASFQGQADLSMVTASTHARGRSGRTQWLASARRSLLDHVLGQLEHDYGDPQFHDELARVQWQGEAAEITAGLMHGNDELSLQDGAAGERAKGDDHGLALWLRGRRRLAARAELDLSASYTKASHDRSGILDDPVDAVGELDDERAFTVYALSSGLDWRLSDRWSIRAGAEGQHQAGEFEAELAARYGELALPLHVAGQLDRNLEAKRDGSALGAYLTAEQRLGSRWTLEYGLRYDLQDMDPVHDVRWSPRLQIAYRPDASLRAYLDVGRYTQHQNLYELQLDDGLLELNAPQSADAVSVGLDWWPLPSLRLRTDAYFRRVDRPWVRFDNIYNPWVLLPELHADRVRVAPDEARSYGGEALVEYRQSPTLRWSLALALARAEERVDGAWRPRPWEQRRTGTVGVDWRPGRWRLGVRATLHDGWPTTSLLTAPLSDDRRLYDRRLPRYFSLDLHAARRFDFGRSALEMYLDLTNATVEDHIGGYRYRSEGGVLVPHARRLLPTMPVLGVRWSW